jgi:hypothetical protein
VRIKKQTSVVSAFIFLVLSSLIHTNCQAQEKEKLSFRDQFVDSTDNAFDISTWMTQAYGFFPIASIITEPATGFGISGGLLRIKRKMELREDSTRIPPDITLVGGLYTENGTWGAMAFHRGHWKKDKIRFDGVIGYFSANLFIYRNDAFGNLRKLGFNIGGPLFTPTLSFRIKNSNSFVGVKYMFLNNVVDFKLSNDQVPLDSTTFKATLSGLGLVYNWDSRDNTFTPNRGMFVHSGITAYDQILGSDLEYSRIDTYWLGFTDILDPVFLGLRLDYRVALKEPPFYSLPFVKLRGVPAFRYQGKHVVVVETEERWAFSRRWSLTGFAGIGKGFGGSSDLNTSETAYSVGGGIRYFLARLLNLYSGIDIAKGPEQWAFYIQLGHYWNGL